MESKPCGRRVREAAQERARTGGLYAFALGKWLVCALILGLVCGLIGSAFYYCIGCATDLRGSRGWLVYLLPAAGIVIVALYRLCGVKTTRARTSCSTPSARKTTSRST